MDSCAAAGNLVADEYSAVILRSGKRKTDSFSSRTLARAVAAGKTGILCHVRDFGPDSDSRTDRSSEFETDVIFSYEVRIRQVSTLWKDNFVYFPMGSFPGPDSSRTGRGFPNKSTVVCGPTEHVIEAAAPSSWLPPPKAI